MGLLGTLVLVTTYVTLLAYFGGSPTVASPSPRSMEGRKLHYSGNLPAPSGSAKSPDEDLMSYNRRQARIVTDTDYPSEDVRPTQALPPVRERVVYVERRPSNYDHVDDDRLNNFNRGLRPESHPDGDILSGQREKPYDDPVGLRAQREEIQTRNNNEGGSILSYLFGRTAPSLQPQTSDHYLSSLSEPSRYLDTMPILPPPTQESTQSRTSNVVGNILRALLSK